MKKRLVQYAREYILYSHALVRANIFCNILKGQREKSNGRSNGIVRTWLIHNNWRFGTRRKTRDRISILHKTNCNIYKRVASESIMGAVLRKVDVSCRRFLFFQRASKVSSFDVYFWRGTKEPIRKKKKSLIFNHGSRFCIEQFVALFFLSFFVSKLLVGWNKLQRLRIHLKVKLSKIFCVRVNCPDSSVS